jgi:hypothetical protein
MDPRTIFVKTAKGIGEIKNKTNHLPGKVRRLLILVDGQSSAAEIAAKISNLSEAKRTEAFDKLLEEGFIRESGVATDTGDEAEDEMLTATAVERILADEETDDDTAQDEETEAAAAAAETARKARADEERRRWEAADRARVDAEERVRAQRDMERQEADEREKRAAEEKSRWEQEQREKLEAQMRAEAQLAEQRDAERRAKEQAPKGPSQAERERAEAEEKKRLRDEHVAKVEEERQRVVAELLGKAKAGEEAKTRAEAEAKRRASTEIENKKRALVRADKETKTRQKIVDRQSKQPMPSYVLPAVGGGVVALLVLAAVVLSYIPFSGDKPAIEKLISERLREKVTVGAVHVGIAPLPHLTLNDVVIGDDGEIKIESATVPWDMFGGDKEKKVYKTVELDTVSVKQAALVKMLGWSAPPEGGAKLVIENLTMKSIRLTLNDVTLDKFDGQVLLATDGSFVKANFFVTEQDRLRAEIANRDGALQVSFSAKKWRAPLAEALVFSDLKFKGVSHPGGIDISDIDALVADGAVKGSGRVDWGDRWKLAANLELTGIDLDGMTQRFTQQISLTGRLDAKLAINAQGASMASLFAAPRVEGEFVLANGALSNVDLMKAIIEAPNYDKVRGGQTVFKKFSGSAVLAEQRLSLKQMSMVSGSLTAGGVIDVMPDNTIAGKINLELGSAESNPVKDTVALTGNHHAVRRRPDSGRRRRTRIRGNAGFQQCVYSAGRGQSKCPGVVRLQP